MRADFQVVLDAFRFGEVRTILTANPQDLAEELFARYVRLEAPALHDVQSAAV